MLLNHRITECVGLEGTHQDGVQLQALCRAPQESYPVPASVVKKLNSGLVLWSLPICEAMGEDGVF